jgi:hypothetical protein
MEMFHIDFGKEIAFSENRILDVSAQECQNGPEILKRNQKSTVRIGSSQCFGHGSAGILIYFGWPDLDADPDPEVKNVLQCWMFSFEG